ncbi:TonB-dependent receptor [Niveispirillum fermenti]|uniref:TonB-dependent receptor n=1 Tax=Niveispirillum fermenti TaxID=1233113 RepID=UPI003A86C6C7
MSGNGRCGHLRWAASLVVLALAPAAVATAQPVTGDGGRLVLEEIIVTAQKRQQPLQAVPLPISAVAAETLEKRGMDEFTDYARAVPGLSFVDRGAGKNKVTLRGISTGVDQNHQSPVGIYIDETPVSYPSNEPDLRLFDVERVEVLRGPQGTLYGAGSMGGTIKIITAKPDLTRVAGAASVQLSSTRKGGENYALNGMVNVPLAQDKAAIRIVGYYRNEDGFIDNAQLSSRDVNDNETWGTRAAAKFALSERFAATASLLIQRTDVGGSQEINPALPGLTQSRAVPEVRNDDLDLYSLGLTYDLDWAELSSSTSYLDRIFDDVRDVMAFLGAPAPVWLNNVVPDRNFVQEIRLASAPSDSVEWIAGLFYSRRKSVLNQYAWHGGVFGVPVGTPLLDSTIRSRLTQKAAFGELTVYLDDRLKVTGGLRAFQVKEKVFKLSDGLIAGGYSTDMSDSSEKKINPKVNLSFQATPDILLYTQAAQGFRVGGPNSTLPPLNGVAAPSSFDSDSLWNYEVGFKSTLWNGRATLNLSAFYIDWTDIQVTVTRADGFSYVTNGDKAVSKGLEGEFSVRPMAGLEIGVAAAYTDAYLSADSRSGAGRKGDRIPAVPRFTYDLFGRYEWDMTAGWSAYTQANLQHVGASYNGFTSRVPAPDRQRGYELANAKVGVIYGETDISLFANNLFDKRAELFVDRTLGDARVNVNRPRTIGVNVMRKF